MQRYYSIMPITSCQNNHIWKLFVIKTCSIRILRVNYNFQSPLLFIPVSINDYIIIVVVGSFYFTRELYGSFSWKRSFSNIAKQRIPDPPAEIGNWHRQWTSSTKTKAVSRPLMTGHWTASSTGCGSSLQSKAELVYTIPLCNDHLQFHLPSEEGKKNYLLLDK
jgi:hypothetical protein